MNSGMWANLGATAANQGRLAEALQFFERAVATNPSNPDAQQKLTALREIMTRT
jgi:Tfp pilus assembly protein PilF